MLTKLYDILLYSKHSWSSCGSKMKDEILDVCYKEGLFDTPLWRLKCKKEKNIKTNNKYPFMDVLKPIYESYKVDKVKIQSLECRSTHEIASRAASVNDSHLLYSYFATLNLDVKFMHTWLHLFIRMHGQYFSRIAVKYFESKGLTMDSWIDCIVEGVKGDVLNLLSLCMLVEKHVIVHLENNQACFKNVPSDHQTTYNNVIYARSLFLRW